jgi:hypothetical protein
MLLYVDGLGISSESLFAVYIINRYIKALVFDGTYNRDIFEGFIIN